MNVLSLFDGMSCGQIALWKNNTKYNNYYASEIDKYAIKATQNNFPNTVQLGSVTEITSENLPKIDLLIGGSPCQGFSFMGNQLNFSDPRSKLFFEYVRLLKGLKPKYFLLENVKMKKEYQDIITKELGVEPVQINSSLVSAQLRKRIYWTNIPFEDFIDKNILLNDVLEYGKADRNKAVCLLTSYSNRTNSQACVNHYKRKSVGQLIIDDTQKTGYRVMTTKECERLQTVPDGYLSDWNNIPEKEAKRMLGNGWTVDVIAHILKNIKCE